jgi:methionyl-tRNA formyltransferase
MKVVLIGGLSNGKIVYDYLKSNKHVDLSLVITYPDENNKPRHTSFGQNSNIVKAKSANNNLKKIKKIAPELIIVAGWSELLSNELIKTPSIGTIGFHPSKLPYDRGRSVLAWQIEENYKETALSMFYYTEIPDAGDIIAQEHIKIEDNDYIDNILDKIDWATYNIMHAYFPLIRKGIAPRKPQTLNEGSFRRLRKEIDSWINWNTNSLNIYNKIRAISKPYPGAIAWIKNRQAKIWKAEIIDFIYGLEEKPGKIIAELYDNTLIVKTKDSFLRVLDYEYL